MIAGLEEITAGELRIADTVVNDMEPKDRDIAMVFQNYALYPHMTVYENMAFGLRLRHLPKEEIDRKVREAAHILGITEYLDRKPKAMSGGQRQRVALGRAIVRNPKVMLLDEPLSNLDAKLRTAMRSEISKLHHKLQTTFIYVTHDQVEAMTMGTRIVVMKDGYVQQIDTPRNLYRFPGNKFVAGFIGTPQMNFFDGTLTQHGNKVTVAFDDTDIKLDAPIEYFHKANRAYLDGSKPVIIGIRAEHISTNPEQYPFVAKCRVSHVEELGTDCQVYADFNLNSDDVIGESPTKVIIKAPAGSYYGVDSVISVSLDLSQLHFFDAETEKTIAPRIPEEVVADAHVAGTTMSALNAEIELPASIRPDDGDYRLYIPTAAVSLGGDISAKVLEEEDVNGQRLVHLQAGETVLFVIVDKDVQLGKTAKISVDLKLIRLERDGETVVQPLNCVNSLVGVISKHKVKAEKEIDGKVKKVNELAFSFDIGGASFDCPRELAMRLVNGGGQHIFGKSLEFRFTPYQAHVCGSAQQVDSAETPATEEAAPAAGMAAVLESCSDYGKEKFATCLIGDKKINVHIDEEISDPIRISLDVEALEIHEVARGIRLA